MDELLIRDLSQMQSGTLAGHNECEGAEGTRPRLAATTVLTDPLAQDYKKSLHHVVGVKPQLYMNYRYLCCWTYFNTASGFLSTLVVESESEQWL